MASHTFSGIYMERGQIIIFLREETAFTLQNKLNKLNLQPEAHRASEGMAHSRVSTGHNKDVTDPDRPHSIHPTFDLTVK